jgi:hypothetical protein
MLLYLVNKASSVAATVPQGRNPRHFRRLRESSQSFPTIERSRHRCTDQWRLRFAMVPSRLLRVTLEAGTTRSLWRTVAATATNTAALACRAGTESIRFLFVSLCGYSSPSVYCGGFSEQRSQQDRAIFPKEGGIRSQSFARARSCGYFTPSQNGGVLVSTSGLMTGRHAEDDSLASLKTGSKINSQPRIGPRGLIDRDVSGWTPAKAGSDDSRLV